MGVSHGPLLGCGWGTTQRNDGEGAGATGKPTAQPLTSGPQPDRPEHFLNQFELNFPLFAAPSILTATVLPNGSSPFKLMKVTGMLLYSRFPCSGLILN